MFSVSVVSLEYPQHGIYTNICNGSTIPMLPTLPQTNTATTTTTTTTPRRNGCHRNCFSFSINDKQQSSSATGPNVYGRSARKGLRSVSTIYTEAVGLSGCFWGRMCATVDFDVVLFLSCWECALETHIHTQTFEHTFLGCTTSVAAPRIDEKTNKQPTHICIHVHVCMYCIRTGGSSF